VDDPKPDWNARDPFVNLLLGAVARQREIMAELDRIAPPVVEGECLPDEGGSPFVLAVLGLIAVGRAVERFLARVPPLPDPTEAGVSCLASAPESVDPARDPRGSLIEPGFLR
jgi:hypothetical protein